MRVWQHQMGGVPRGIAIADESLRFRLLESEHDRAALKAAERSGIVRSVPGSADPVILQLAKTHGACVLSRDHFRDYRGLHPWIQGCVDRFFEWKLGANGQTTIIARDMGHTSPASLSRHAEIGLLRGRGLDADRASDREILSRAYRCTNKTCLTAQLYPERLLVPPQQRDGRPRCPGCGRALTDLGLRAPTIKIVIETRDGTKLLERTLQEGQDLMLGREDIDAGTPRLGRVSRRHVSLGMHDGRLSARDLDSRNGTTLIRWEKRHAAYAPAVVLDGEPTALGRRDLLILAGAVRLRRSGERFAIGAPGAIQSPRGAAATTAEDALESR